MFCVFIVLILSLLGFKLGDMFVFDEISSMEINYIHRTRFLILNFRYFELSGLRFFNQKTF